MKLYALLSTSDISTFTLYLIGYEIMLLLVSKLSFERTKIGECDAYMTPIVNAIW